MAAPEVAARVFPPTEPEWVRALSFFRITTDSQDEVGIMARHVGNIGCALVRGNETFNPVERFSVL